MGSIIFDDKLQANANRVVLEYISIVLRKACWAPAVMLQRFTHYFNKSPNFVSLIIAKLNYEIRDLFSFYMSRAV